MRTMGDDLTIWRKLRNLTAAEVADRAGVGVNTVLRLERGDGATLENVLRIARALGVLDALVSGAQQTRVAERYSAPSPIARPTGGGAPSSIVVKPQSPEPRTERQEPSVRSST